MTAGYSGTPLAKKLGLKPGQRVSAPGAPPNYRKLLAPLPACFALLAAEFVFRFDRLRRGPRGRRVEATSVG